MKGRAFLRQRPLVCLAALFGLGLFIGGRLPLRFLPLMGGGLLAAALLTALLRAGHKGMIAGLCFLSLFGGMLYANHAAHPALPPEGKYSVEARIWGEAERRPEDDRVKALLRDLTLQGANGLKYRLSGAYWTWYPAPDSPLPLDGQRISMSSTLYHPDGQMNPYGFDFRLYLLQKGIPVGLSGGREISLSPSDQTAPASPWLRARQSLGALLDRVLEGDSALFKALLLGERGDLPEETSIAFRDTGIAHVLSVSGLHTGFLVALLFILLKALGLGPKGRLIAVAVFLLMYCRLLDFAAPVVRAAILSLLLLTARLFHRRSDPLTSLAIAFVVILLFRPLDIYQVGFQLSFLAVLGIFTLGDRLQAMYLRRMDGRPLLRRLRQPALALGTTAAAMLFTAPLTMTVFHQASPLGLLWSPVACLIVGVLMAGGLALMPLALISLPLAGTLAWPLIRLSRLLTGASRAMAALPLATLQTAAPGAAMMLALFLALWLMTRYVILRRPLRWLLPAGGLAIALALGLASQPGTPRYIQFSAGSADAAVIEDGALTLGIDAGENGSELASYLLSRGRRLDRLYITHLHSDHIGGLRQLMAAGVSIGEIILPEGALLTEAADDSREVLRAAESAGIPVSYAAAGDRERFGKVAVRVLWPYRGRVYPGMDANHSSLVMLWDLDGTSILTASDLTSDYEHYAAQPAQVLKIAHHGSKYSSSAAFLGQVQPQIALLTTSDSLQERATAARGRLGEIGCEVFSTNTSGALTLTASPEGLIIEEYAKRGDL